MALYSYGSPMALYSYGSLIASALLRGRSAVETNSAKGRCREKKKGSSGHLERGRGGVLRRREVADHRDEVGRHAQSLYSYGLYS